MQQNESEPRRAVITITEEGPEEVSVDIEFSPSAGEAGACAALGMIGFQAIVNAYRKAAGEELETQTERETKA